jgi:hypothetical protein
MARKALDDISYELLSSSITTFSPPNPKGSTYLRFQKNTGFENGAITWSNPYQLEIEKTGSLRKVIMWEDIPPYNTVRTTSDGDPHVMATTLTEDGLSFTLSGSRLTIDVGIIKEVPRQMDVEAHCSTTVTMRN